MQHSQIIGRWTALIAIASFACFGCGETQAPVKPVAQSQPSSSNPAPSISPVGESAPLQPIETAPPAAVTQPQVSESPAANPVSPPLVAPTESPLEPLPPSTTSESALAPTTPTPAPSGPVNPLRNGNESGTGPRPNPLQPSDNSQPLVPIPPPGDGQPVVEPKSAPAVQPASAIEAEMIRRNGALFQDWPPPKAALVITGLQDGYLEPCGCAGKENMKGGVSRRDMLSRRLLADKWPVLALDVGGLVKRFGRQQELKYQATVDAMRGMGYAAIGFGPADLRLSAAELFAIVSPVGNQPSPFVSANVGIFGFDEKVVPRTRVVEVGGMKIGVTSVLGDEYRRTVQNQDIELKPAAESLAEVLPALDAAKCDRLVLLAHATLAESMALAKKFPQFSIVVSAGGADEPPAEPQPVDGTNTQLIEVGHKGMFAVVLGMYDDPRTPLRYQRVPLDARFGDSPRMKQVMASYQDQLKELGLAGLGVRPAKHPSGRNFVGSAACADCHTKAHEVWSRTPHASALDTLIHADPPRLFDAECLSCHVTGWEPQKFFPFASGYVSREQTPKLAGNGCENCHGPASSHVAAELGEVKVDAAEIEKFRDELRLNIKTPAGKEKAIANCRSCHDIDNSPSFDFDTYWPDVAHPGKD